MVFLRFILLLIIIYYLGKFIFRIFFPYLFQQYVNRETGGSGYKKENQGQKRKREGEVTIDYLSKKQKKIGKDKGEYIDFKEVK